MHDDYSSSPLNDEVQDGGVSAACGRPSDAAELRIWLKTVLDLEIPDIALVDGHHAPFDYLCHAFFDGQSDGRAAGRSDGRDGIDSPHGVRAGTASSDSIVWANRGGGKTFLAAVATLLDLVHKPGISVRILGGSLDQSKRLYAHLRALFEGSGDEGSGLMGMVDGRITQRGLRLKNGSEAQVLAQSQTAVRGTRVQKIRCDEVELFDPEVWEAAQLATMGKECGGQWVPGTIECLSTMHVPYGLMYRLVRDAQGGESADQDNGDRSLFKWGVIDVLERCPEERDCSACPLQGECGGKAKRLDNESAGGQEGGAVGGHLAVSDVVQLKSRVGSSTWQAEMLCARPRRDDCVLPEFDRSRHVVRTFDPGLASEWIAGMDFGIRAPTVVLWGAIDSQHEHGGVIRIVGERVISGEPIATHVEAIRAGGHGVCAPFPTPAWIGVDPAGRQRSEQTGVSTIEIMRRSGLVIRDKRLGIAAGLDLLRARLKPATGAPTLLVHESCEKLVESLERYRYPSDQPESTVPVKDGSDHAVDALRYMVQNLDAGYRVASGRYV